MIATIEQRIKIKTKILHLNALYNVYAAHRYFSVCYASNYLQKQIKMLLGLIKSVLR